MKAEDAILILMSWRQNEDPCTISGLHEECVALDIRTDRSTVARTIERMRNDGYVSCLGHDHVEGQWIARQYCLTGMGRIVAQQRREMMTRLLNTPPEELHG